MFNRTGLVCDQHWSDERRFEDVGESPEPFQVSGDGEVKMKCSRN